MAVDVFPGAGRAKEITLKPYNRWYWYAGILVLVSLGMHPLGRLIAPSVQFQ